MPQGCSVCRRTAPTWAVTVFAKKRRAETFEKDGREFIALLRIFEAESYCAGRIDTMLSYPPAPVTALESQISAIETANGISYDEHQKQAIVSALSKGILILTGGPGTGKTTTLRAIITILEQQGLEFSLAAPTGRAAQRMSDLTGCEAKTLPPPGSRPCGDENGYMTFGKIKKALSIPMR